jgi:hypothetical protein
VARLKKDATLNMKISQRLYDAVKAEAEKMNLTTSAYVRAVLARQVYGKQTQQLLGEELLVIDEDEAYLLDF